jgi:ElaA protein
LTGTTVLPRSAALQWRCLPFSAMSADTLYRLLRLRSEVFVVEQACVFLDLDGLDQQCLHVLGEFVAPTLPASRGSLPPEGARFALGRPGGETVDADVTVQLHASTRLVPPGMAFAEASIGRVVTAPAARGGGIGHALMAESLRLLEQIWGAQPIRIGAQAHLESFYNRHGFLSDNKPYIEDGIPHIEMIRR